MTAKSKHLLFVFIFQCSLSCTSAFAEKFETFKGKAIFDGTKTLTIKHQKENKTYVKLIMDSYGCAGAIEGVGKVNGDIITVTDKNEDKTCRITIRFKGDTAEIKESSGCFFWHGVPKGCDFNGTLFRVD